VVNKLAKNSNLAGKRQGRPKGATNKTTKDVRAMVAAFAEKNASKFEDWVNRTAEGDLKNGVRPQPDKAAALYLSAIEYHIPKLARTEHSGEGGGPVKFEISAPWLKPAIADRNK
jgi:hypothetical protein